VVLPNGKRLIFFDERIFFTPSNGRHWQKFTLREIGAAYAASNPARNSPALSTLPSTQLGAAQRTVRRLQPNSAQPGAAYAALNPAWHSPAQSTPPPTQLGTARRSVRRLQPSSEQPSAGYAAVNRPSVASFVKASEVVTMTALPLRGALELKKKEPFLDVLFKRVYLGEIKPHQKVGL